MIQVTAVGPMTCPLCEYLPHSPRDVTAFSLSNVEDGVLPILDRASPQDYTWDCSVS